MELHHLHAIPNIVRDLRKWLVLRLTVTFPHDIRDDITIHYYSGILPTSENFHEKQGQKDDRTLLDDNDVCLSVA